MIYITVNYQTWIIDHENELFPNISGTAKKENNPEIYKTIIIWKMFYLRSNQKLT